MKKRESKGPAKTPKEELSKSMPSQVQQPMQQKNPMQKLQRPSIYKNVM
jgi:Tfp pilus assembly protein FimV